MSLNLHVSLCWYVLCRRRPRSRGLSQHRCRVTHSNSSHWQRIARLTASNTDRCYDFLLLPFEYCSTPAAKLQQRITMAEGVPGFREQAKMAAGHVQATLTVSLTFVELGALTGAGA